MHNRTHKNSAEVSNGKLSYQGPCRGRGWGAAPPLFGKKNKIELRNMHFEIKGIFGPFRSYIIRWVQ